jgi:hypothetical protein
MRRFNILLLLLAAALSSALLACSASRSPSASPSPIVPAPAAAPPPAPTFAGHWEGAIIRTLGRDETDLTLDLAPGEGGVWAGKLNILMGGVKDRPLSSVTVDGPGITFVDADEHGQRVYQGKLSADGDRIVGELQRGERTVPFELDRKADFRLPAESELRDLSADSRELRQLFDEDKDKVRMVLLLSPT